MITILFSLPTGRYVFSSYLAFICDKNNYIRHKPAMIGIFLQTNCQLNDYQVEIIFLFKNIFF